MGKLFEHNTVAADFTVLEFSEYRFCLHRVWCWPLERVQVSVQSNFWRMSASGFCLLSHTPPDRILSSSLSHNFLFHYYQLKSFSSQTFSYENQVNYYTLKRNHCLSQRKLQLLKCSWHFGLRQGHWYWLERPLGGLVDLRGAALAQVVCRTTWGGFVCAWSRLSTRRLIYTWNTVLLARISLRCLEINAFQVPLVLAIPGAQIFMHHVCYFPRIKKVYLCPLSSNPNLRLLWQWLSMRFVEILLLSGSLSCVYTNGNTLLSGLKSWLRAHNKPYWALWSMMPPQSSERPSLSPVCCARLTQALLAGDHLVFHKLKMFPDMYFISLVILHTFLGFFGLALWKSLFLLNPL